MRLARLLMFAWADRGAVRSFFVDTNMELAYNELKDAETEPLVRISKYVECRTA